MSFKINLNNVVFFGIPALYVLYLLFSSSSSHEVSWNEFRTTMLEKGFVDHLQVVGNSTVRIYLRPDAPQMARVQGFGF
jgi:AFG3 family protein